jgi:hypothetical protein
MRIKSVTLYSLPYVVGVASFLVAAHQVAPSLTTLRLLSGTSTKSAIISGQVVNRSLKSDRLPIKQAVPQADDERQIKLPGQIAPNQKNKTDCKSLLALEIPLRGRQAANPRGIAGADLADER